MAKIQTAKKCRQTGGQTAFHLYIVDSNVANSVYLSEQFSKTFITLQIIGKLPSCIKVHVNSFINYVINMLTIHLLFYEVHSLHKL